MSVYRVNAPKTLPPNNEIPYLVAQHFPQGFRGYAIDVGASDGKYINSTYLLEHMGKWTVVSVEANPMLKPLLLENRAWVEMCACGSKPKDDVDFHVNLDNLEAFSSLIPQKTHRRFKEEAGDRWEKVKVNVRTVDQLIEKWQFPRLDALFVDVEGTERDVLEGCDLAKWKPKVVVVESWDEGSHDVYLESFGYRRYAKSAENDLYVRGDEM
jgi:methyltransferase, FkbM family